MVSHLVNVTCYKWVNKSTLYVKSILLTYVCEISLVPAIVNHLVQVDKRINYGCISNFFLNDSKVGEKILTLALEV